MASALATFAASVFKGTFNVEIQVGENEPAEAAIRRFRRGVLNSGVLPEVRPPQLHQFIRRAQRV